MDKLLVVAVYLSVLQTVKTGSVEVQVESIEVLSGVSETLPFQPHGKMDKVGLTTVTQDRVWNHCPSSRAGA